MRKLTYLLPALFLGLCTSVTEVRAGNPTFYTQNYTQPGGGAPFTWTGLAGDHNWTNTGNWSTGVVPGSTDVAKFLGANCSGSNCNVTINASVSVAGVVMDAAYSGVMTQASSMTVAVGTSGWSQAGGTFTGGDSDIVITDSSFALSGGTFNSTSGNLKIAVLSGAGYTVFSQSAGTFNPGSGTLYFTIDSAGCVNGTTYTIDVNSSLTLNNLRYAGGHPSSANTCTWALGAGDSLTTNGNFNITRDLAAGSIAATGTINVKGDLTYGTGTNGGTLIVNVIGTGTQNFTQSAGTTTPSGLLTINKASGSLLSAAAASINSSLTIAVGTLDASSFTFAVGGTLLVNPGATIRETIITHVSATSWSLQLGCNWEEYGAGSMTWYWSDAYCNFTINKPGYTVTMVGVTQIRGNFNILGGTVNQNGYSLTLLGNWNHTGGTYSTGTGPVILSGTNQAITGSNSFYSLTKSAASAQTLTIAAGTTQTITHDLTLTGTSAAARLSLRSDTPGTQWLIDAQGTRSLDYLDVRDSDNINVTVMSANNTSVDSGNNINWSFSSPFTWTGLAGNNLWNDTGNWSTGVVPGSSDVAKFYAANCTGTNCNATVNVAANVAGLLMDSTYTGTITQASGITMAIGSSGWSQAGGTFTGSDSDIVITDSSFALSGGTFNSTSGNLKIAALSGAGYTVFNKTGGTFNAGTGTLYYTIDSTGCVNGTHYVITSNAALTLNNLTYAGGHPSAANTCYWDLGAGQSLTTNGNFTMGQNLGAGSVGANIGTINVKGDLTYADGTNGGALIVNLTGAGTQNMTQSGVSTLPSGLLTINKASGSALMTTSFNKSGSPITVTSGTLDAQNNVLTTSTFTVGASGTFRSYRPGDLVVTGLSELAGCTWEYYGATSFAVNWGSTFTCSVIFSKPAGYSITSGSIFGTSANFTLSSGTFSSNGYSVSVSGNWTNSGGTFTPGTSVVTLSGTNQTVTGSTTFYDLSKISGGSTLTVAAGTTLTVTDALTLKGVSTTSRLSLRSGTPGSQWNIDAQGTRALNWLNVKDSDGLNVTALDGTDTSIDSGNNTNWVFNSTGLDRKIFYTSIPYAANIGSVAAADTACGTRATAGGLAGTYKAWMAVTTGTDDPATTFTHATVPYKMVDGTVIANNWAQLTSGNLAAAITLDELGANSSGATNRWTNVAANGTASSSGSSNANNCTGWTSANGARKGRIGSPNVSGATWTDNGATTDACNVGTNRLICVQQ